MRDLDAVERQLARDPLCSEANVPDLIAELRAAREVKEAARAFLAALGDSLHPNLTGSRKWDLTNALAAYDKVTGEVAG